MSEGAVDLPALAAAVRGGQWAEVRAATAAAAAPLPPAAALVAARAAARAGAGSEALALLAEALPRAGELAAALRLEGGAIALARGDSPWRWVGGLVRGGVSAPHARAASELLRRSFQQLPVATLRRQRETLPLPRALRRDLEAAIAARGGDVAIAIRLLRESRSDEPAARVARVLAARPDLAAGVRLQVGEALLAAGWWSEAEAVLAAPAPDLPVHLRGSLEYLRGRAAYRRGKLAEAAPRFAAAIAHATDAQQRFDAAVQRARVAERSGDLAGALPLWDAARHARPQEVEGWDGAARARAVLGRAAEALALLAVAPPKALGVAGPRLAAVLLARGELAAAEAQLSRLPPRQPARRALAAALAARRGDAPAARAAVRELLGDRSAGAWRALAIGLLPAPEATPSVPRPEALPARDPRELADTAAEQGSAAARARLAAALAGDPAWRALAAGEAPAEPAWDGPAHALVAVGLPEEAAALYPSRFPGGTPAELAWSAAALAGWGNGPAALAAGERLLAALGDLPPAFVPDAVLRRALPEELTADCRAAAAGAGAPPAWIAGIVRRESRFDHAARSRAGAIGIAQVVPETARRLGAAPEALWDSRRALALAAGEVERIRVRFGDRLPVVAAAYNAGDEVVDSWLAALGPGADDVLFAAAVPYGETAGYVLAVVEGAALARYLE